MDTSKRMYEIGIVPVVKLNDAKHAVPLAKALVAGGINCAEITFRTDAAVESIRRISEEVPNMLVGAGTVLTVGQVKQAVEAGAQFIVSPGFSPPTVKYCVDNNIPIYPGCGSAGDVALAMEFGLHDLKFFPAEQSGGLSMIKALCGPFGSVRFMPTGGINESNLNEYLSFDKVFACGGTWMVKEELIAAERFDEIEALTRAAIHTMLGFELCHLGINCEDEQTATAEAKRMGALLGLPVKARNSSVFSGVEFEFMKKIYHGKNGHIAIATNNVDRAYAYLALQGYEFREETFVFDQKTGKRKSGYLKDEIGGFAIHLLQK